jgi:hypothetical protein
MRGLLAPCLVACLLAGLVAGLAGCGYSFTPRGGEASALHGNVRALFLDSVENPTTETWLGPEIRARLRDELTRRGSARWTSRDAADGLVRVVVDRFTRSSSVTDESEDTVKYSVSLTLAVTITDAATGEPVWASGNVGWSDSYYASDSASERDASERAVELAVRRVADLLAQGY